MTQPLSDRELWETCPTCGSIVRVESSDEGTTYYVPDALAEEVLRLRSFVESIARLDPSLGPMDLTQLVTDARAALQEGTT